MVSYTKPDSLTEDPNEPPGGYSHTHTHTHTDYHDVSLMMRGSGHLETNSDGSERLVCCDSFSTADNTCSNWSVVGILLVLEENNSTV